MHKEAVPVPVIGLSTFRVRVCAHRHYPRSQVVRQHGQLTQRPHQEEQGRLRKFGTGKGGGVNNTKNLADVICECQFDFSPRASRTRDSCIAEASERDKIL